MLVKYLLKAYKGKFLWSKIKKKYGNGYKPSRYILFPSSDDEYNAWGLYYLGYFIKKNHLDKVMIVTCDDCLEAAVKNFKQFNLHVVKITADQMSNIIRFAALINLNGECTIVSVREPYDTGAERLLGKKGVTKQEIVWYDVYRMSEKFDEAPTTDTSHWKNAQKYIEIINDTENQ